MIKVKDPKWEKVKKIVDLRDHHQCQFTRCLSMTEFHQLKVEPPKTLDRCHIFSRSNNPELIYNKNNIITLSRFIHQRMDNFKSPLDNSFIEDNNYHWYWWYRIVFHKIEKYNIEKDYQIELKNFITNL